MHSLLAAVLLLTLNTVRSALAQACSEGGTYVNVTGGVDPHDGTHLGIYFLFVPCAANTVALTVTYTGVDGFTTTETSTAAYPSSSPYDSTSYQSTTFSFTGYNTNIQPGSPVSIGGAEYYPDGQMQQTGTPLSFTYTPVTSNYFTLGSATFTETTSAVKDTTTVSRSTTTITGSQATKTSDCKTSTSTVTAPTQTITSTITSDRPHDRTVTTTVYSTVTKHTSCVPKSSSTAKRAPANEKRQGGGQAPSFFAETPWFTANFGPPTPTTYTTATSYSFVTSTVYYSTSTSTKVVTVTKKKRAHPATTTVCETAVTTLTTTPKTTKTVTKVSQLTTTSTISSTITSTIYPKSPTVCKPGATHAITALHAPDALLFGK